MKPSGRLVGPASPAARRVEGQGRPVLAFHGYGGTPREVDLVLDVAAELGRPAWAPLLPGHGTHARDLGATRFAHWADAGDRALADLGRPAVVTGISMGSLVALELALRHPERVAALVLIANAAWLTSPFPDWALRAVDRLKVPDFWLPKVGADLADPAARRSHVTYDAQPVRAAVSVLRAGESLRTRVHRVTQPVLLLHGARDRVCPASNAPRLRALLGSRDAEVRVFPRSRHILTRDLERREVASALRVFLSRH